MAITDDLAQLENLLNELIIRYEQYFVGHEKREPLQLRSQVELLLRKHTGVKIPNTMLRHRYSLLTARFNTYREHWNRTVRLIEEGRYSRDRFISDLHQRTSPRTAHESGAPASDVSAGEEVDRVFREYREARLACGLPVESLSRETVATAMERHKSVLTEKFGSGTITYRVVVEDGKPKIKAGRTA